MKRTPRKSTRAKARPVKKSATKKSSPSPFEGAAWEQMVRNVHKEQLLSQLVGGIAHDFNNIIGVILGYSDLILRKLPEDSPVRAKLESIRVVSRKASQLTRQLLTFSRSTGTIPQFFEVQPYLQSVMSIIQRLLTEKVEVVLKPCDSKIKLEMDAGSLDQILLGLTARLRPALVDGGKLLIELEPEVSPGYLAIRLEACPANGPEKTTTAFERYKVEMPRPGDWEMVAVHELVSWISGHLEVSSKTPERVVRVCLPVARSLGPTAVRTLPKLGSSAHHILVVEDEEPVREMAQEILQEAGYTVNVASNGEEALEFMEANERLVDLVFTDMVMPRMGGMELVVHLRKRKPDVRVLYTSGYAPEGVFQQQLLTQKVHFLAKPYEPTDLIQKVAQLLSVG